MRGRPGRTPCAVDDCDRYVASHGYCLRHWRRVQRFGVPERPDGLPLRPRNDYVTSQGYVRRKLPDGTVAHVHRLVMEETIGRALLPGETVHHRNGIRHDNRPENLELWASWQPAGQRVEDLVAYAREVLDRYGDLVGAHT